MSKEITVLGGGIIGLSCAYYLNQIGYSVRVIDQRKIGDSCALGNAGYITPSHFVPLAAPGMVKKGIQWMLNPESPFYIHPKLDWSLLSWLWQFNRHCTRSHVERVKQALFELCSHSHRLYLDLEQVLPQKFQFQHNGIYVVSQTAKAQAEELALVRQAQQLGMNAREVSRGEFDRVFPDMEFDIDGGIYFPEDSHVHPGEFLSSLHNELKIRGVEFCENIEVKSILSKGARVTKVVGETQSFSVDELVLACGSWTPELAKQLGISIPIQAGKGYSVTVDKPWEIETPIILNEAAVAITPFKDKIRFAGTMEIAGVDLSINTRRVDGILKSVKRYIPNFDIESIDKSEAWAGLRPCSADGLPLIGRLPSYQNLTIAAGHAMLGLTLAPVTGQIIAEIISDQYENKYASILPTRFDSVAK
ncbi:MAG: FAD-dependent oxidoreductase [Kangiellaceae bacterium]|nr:FAD-dependent oxidoreductase [Kangiellaceae bacterium]